MLFYVGPGGAGCRAPSLESLPSPLEPTTENEVKPTSPRFYFSYNTFIQQTSRISRAT